MHATQSHTTIEWTSAGEVHSSGGLTPAEKNDLLAILQHTSDITALRIVTDGEEVANLQMTSNSTTYNGKKFRKDHHS
jgi:hypothetical protein